MSVKSRRLSSMVGVASTIAITASMLPMAAGASAPSFVGQVHGSTDEAYVINATPGDTINAINGSHQVVGSGTVDSLGSLVIRNLTPGAGFTFQDTTTNATSTTFTVLAPGAAQPAGLYNQTLHVGLNYVTMRDGVKIAATLRLPPGKTLADGPFPTVMEYSGYATAGPASLIDHLVLGHPASPLEPSSATMVGSLIAPELGFASVSVQMRGSGCSGGAFDLFGYPSDYDGYDMIQTIANQTWAANHKVAMVGISYSGISQLEVAGTHPPALAGITPLSPTDDLFSTGYPGGIYNNGFAAGWIADRIHDAKPALVTFDAGHNTWNPVDSSVAQPWTYAEISAEEAASNNTGSVCKSNQAMHLQSESLSTLVGPGLTRDPALFDRRSPTVWAKTINAPVYLVGALQDEQTGPQWPALIAALSHDGNPSQVFSTMINGDHIDSLGPATISRWLEFLDIYLARKVPTTSGVLNFLAPILESTATAGAKVMPIPAIRFQHQTTVAGAQAAFEANTPRVRVLFDNGGTSLGAGSLQPGYEASFSTWPPAPSTRLIYNLGLNGSLSTSTQGVGTASFQPDPTARPAINMNDASTVWAGRPDWNWTAVPAANGVAFQTAPFANDTTFVGPAKLKLLLNSTTPTTDLQVSVTEVRPNEGREVYVTSGFIRSTNRNLLTSTDVPWASTLWPQPDYLHGAADMTSGTTYPVSIPIDTIAHTFRKGTALRIVISAPGGDRPAWTFDHSSWTPGTDTINLVGSFLVVNQITGISAPAITGTQACSLRGEPCRAYAKLGNQA